MIVRDEDKVFIARSKLRKEVLIKINKTPVIASFLAKDMNKHRESISRVLLDLEKQDFVKCKNPEAANFRFYQITTKGKIFLKDSKSHEQQISH